MKLIIAGANGYVATELIRQSLRLSSITSVIALARRPVQAPQNLYPNSDTSKLKSVVVKDFGAYSEEDKQNVAGADACIWTLAITPTKSKSMDWEDVHRVCHDYALAGLNAVFEGRNQHSDGRPFRFMYMSGSAAERDQTKAPTFMPKYSLMRGDVENKALEFAEQHKGEIEVCAAKPGLIKDPGISMKGIMGAALNLVGIVPSILVTEVSAAMLDQVLNGFTEEPLTNEDLVRIGKQALESSLPS